MDARSDLALLTAAITALQGKRPPDDPVTAFELLDALWLARTIGIATPELPRQPAEPMTEAEPESRTPTERDQLPVSKSKSEQAPAENEKNEQDEEEQDEEEQEDDTEVYVDATSPGMPRRDLPATPMRAPGAAALPNSLRIARALRPLMKRIPSRNRRVIDETATAERIAETGLYVAAMRPVPSRWLDLALVIDRGGAMDIWEKVVAELRVLLERHSAFRVVRCWTLDGQLQLRTWSGMPRTVQEREPISPTGRQLTVVVSDCIAPSWHDGKAATLLSKWSASSPLMIVQVMPRHLWSRTALALARRTTLNTTAPAVPNSLMIASGERAAAGSQSPSVRVPVTTLESGLLAQCANLIAATGGASAPGFLFPLVVDEATIAELTQTDAQVPAPSAEQRVADFNLNSTADARELARHLAVAPYPLTLPIIRLLRRTLLPSSDGSIVAETILGGLMRRVSGEGINGDRVVYDFDTPEIRNCLADQGRKSDTQRVMSLRMSEYVGEHLGQLIDFGALMENPAADAIPASIDAGSEPFARLGIDSLRRIGDLRSQEIADRVERRLARKKASKRAGTAAKPAGRFRKWFASGHPRRRRVELAAYLGDREAMRLTRRPRNTASAHSWVAGLSAWGVRVLLQCAITTAELTGAAGDPLLAAARACLSRRERRRDPELDQLLDDWISSPSTKVEPSTFAALAAFATGLAYRSRTPVVQEIERLVANMMTLSGQRGLREEITKVLLADLLRDDALVFDPVPDRGSVLVTGSASRMLSPWLQAAAEELGAALIRSGYSVRAGNFIGVDTVVAQSAEAELEFLGRLGQRIERLMSEPRLRRGTRNVSGTIPRSEAFVDLRAVVSIGGHAHVPATLERAAKQHNLPVLPLPWTGGASAAAPQPERQKRFLTTDPPLDAAVVPALIRRVVAEIDARVDADIGARRAGYATALIDVLAPVRTLPLVNTVIADLRTLIPEVPNMPARSLDEALPEAAEWAVFDLLRLAEVEAEDAQSEICAGPLAKALAAKSRDLALWWLQRRAVEAATVDLMRPAPALRTELRHFFPRESDLASWIEQSTGVPLAEWTFRASIPQPVWERASSANAGRTRSRAEKLSLRIRPRVEWLGPYLSSKDDRVRFAGLDLLSSVEAPSAAQVAKLIIEETARAKASGDPVPLLIALMGGIAALLGLLEASPSNLRLVARALEYAVTRYFRDPKSTQDAAMRRVARVILDTMPPEVGKINRAIDRAARGAMAIPLKTFPHPQPPASLRDQVFAGDELSFLFRNSSEGHRRLVLRLISSLDPASLSIVREALSTPHWPIELSLAAGVIERFETSLAGAELQDVLQLLREARSRFRSISLGAAHGALVRRLEQQAEQPDGSYGPVAVVGSEADVPFQPFCSQLGAALVTRELPIVTASERLAEAMCEEMRNPLAPGVVVLLTRSARTARAPVGASVRVAGNSLRDIRAAMIANARVVIVFGGAEGTLEEYALARRRGLPVIAVESSGGTAAAITKQSRADLTRLAEGWKLPTKREETPRAIATAAMYAAGPLTRNAGTTDVSQMRTADLIGALRRMSGNADRRHVDAVAELLHGVLAIGRVGSHETGAARKLAKSARLLADRHASEPAFLEVFARCRFTLLLVEAAALVTASGRWSREPIVRRALAAERIAELETPDLKTLQRLFEHARPPLISRNRRQDMLAMLEHEWTLRTKIKGKR